MTNRSYLTLHKYDYEKTASKSVHRFVGNVIQTSETLIYGLTSAQTVQLQCIDKLVVSFTCIIVTCKMQHSPKALFKWLIVDLCPPAAEIRLLGKLMVIL